MNNNKHLSPEVEFTQSAIKKMSEILHELTGEGLYDFESISLAYGSAEFEEKALSGIKYLETLYISDQRADLAKKILIDSINYLRTNDAALIKTITQESISFTMDYYRKKASHNDF